MLCHVGPNRNESPPNLPEWFSPGLPSAGCIHPNLREYKHMTVTIDLPKEIEARLLSAAQASGVPFVQLVQDVLIDHFEETEDRLVAESRLQERQAPITAHQLRKNLGLDN
jgi:predicted DNA-binding protein